jgi:hypothetical protein
MISQSKIIILSLAAAFLMIACGTQRNAANLQDFKDLRELVDSRQFEIQHEWASPLGGGMINLIGNPNHIRFKGDSIDVFLPYFGVRHAGAGYGREGGIRFEGVPSKLNVQENNQNKNIIINFQASKETENLQFSITLFPNGSANTSVNSSQRSSISYRGEIRKLPEERK